MKDLGEAIKFYKKTKAISTKELAKQLGVTETIIHYWEHGIRTPKLDNIQKMAKVFKIKVEQLTQYL